MQDMPSPTIVGLGEAVFDIFNDRSVLGGAPLNMAVCAHQLLAPLDGAGVVASRAGADDWGRQLYRSLKERRMNTDFVQLDPDRPTGRVLVTITEDEPSYDICSPAAWDALQFDRRFVTLANNCSAVCFGSLAQRSVMTREAVERFLRNATQAFKLFDVNLRQDYFSAITITQSLHLADALKLNEHELVQISQLLEMPDGRIEDSSWCDGQCYALGETYNLDYVALTRGARGTVLYSGNARHEMERVSYPQHPEADSVGAGDAASAGLLVGHVLGWPTHRTLALANHLGAFLASVPGATPVLCAETLEMTSP